MSLFQNKVITSRCSSTGEKRRETSFHDDDKTGFLLLDFDAFPGRRRSMVFKEKAQAMDSSAATKLHGIR